MNKNKTRNIFSLEWSRYSSQEYFNGGTIKNLTTSQKRGLSFEKKFGKLLEGKLGGRVEIIEILNGPWIEFKDKNGIGIAQPDFVVELKNKIIIFECKLSYTTGAWGQLNKLYRPLVGKIYPNKKIHTIQVCKRLTKKIDYFEIHKVEDIFELNRKDSFLHLPFL